MRPAELPSGPTANPTPEEHIHLLAHRHDTWSVDEIFKHYADKADPAVAFFGNSREVVIHLLANERQAVKDGARPRISMDNRCGKCGAMARVNYDPKHLPFQSFTWPGKGVDMDVDFESWDTSALRDRVELVWSFDQACEEACRCFLDFAVGHKVQEREILVPRKVLVAVEA